MKGIPAEFVPVLVLKCGTKAGSVEGVKLPAIVLVNKTPAGFVPELMKVKGKTDAV